MEALFSAITGADVPPEFVCPISREWFESSHDPHPLSPLTGKPLASRALTNNHSLKGTIQAWRARTASAFHQTLALETAIEGVMQLKKKAHDARTWAQCGGLVRQRVVRFDGRLVSVFRKGSRPLPAHGRLKHTIDMGLVRRLGPALDESAPPLALDVVEHRLGKDRVYTLVPTLAQVGRWVVLLASATPISARNHLAEWRRPQLAELLLAQSAPQDRKASAAGWLELGNWWAADWFAPASPRSEQAQGQGRGGEVGGGREGGSGGGGGDEPSSDSESEGVGTPRPGRTGAGAVVGSAPVQANVLRDDRVLGRAPMTESAFDLINEIEDGVSQSARPRDSSSPRGSEHGAEGQGGPGGSATAVGSLVERGGVVRQAAQAGVVALHLAAVAWCAMPAPQQGVVPGWLVWSVALNLLTYAESVNGGVALNWFPRWSPAQWRTALWTKSQAGPARSAFAFELEPGESVVVPVAAKVGDIVLYGFLPQHRQLEFKLLLAGDGAYVMGARCDGPLTARWFLSNPAGEYFEGERHTERSGSIALVWRNRALRRNRVTFHVSTRRPGLGGDSPTTVLTSTDTGLRQRALAVLTVAAFPAWCFCATVRTRDGLHSPQGHGGLFWLCGAMLAVALASLAWSMCAAVATGAFRCCRCPTTAAAATTAEEGEEEDGGWVTRFRLGWHLPSSAPRRLATGLCVLTGDSPAVAGALRQYGWSEPPVWNLVGVLKCAQAGWLQALVVEGWLDQRAWAWCAQLTCLGVATGCWLGARSARRAHSHACSGGTPIDFAALREMHVCVLLVVALTSDLAVVGFALAAPECVGEGRFAHAAVAVCGVAAGALWVGALGALQALGAKCQSLSRPNFHRLHDGAGNHQSR